MKLKKCPCGKVPAGLEIIETGSSKYYMCTGSCCSEWSIEFRSDYLDIWDDKVMIVAACAWNSAERGDK